MKKMIIYFIFSLIIIGYSFSVPLIAQVQKRSFTLENNRIKGTITLDGLSLLADPSDPVAAVLIGDRSWGRAHLIYTIEGKHWLEHDAYNRFFVVHGDTAVSIIDYASGMPLRMEQRYTLTAKGIDFDIYINSKMQFPVKIGDLGVHFPTRQIPRAWTAWRTGTGESLEYIDQYIFDIFERAFIRHQYISGNGSFLYYTKHIGESPYLIVLPKRGTKIEYFDRSEGGRFYIHSEFSGNRIDGSWRQKHTAVSLSPKGGNKTALHYGFKFRWADSYDEMRQILYEEGLFDIRVVPGMTIPSDLNAKFSLRTLNRIDSITAEFPEESKIRFLGEKLPDHYVYEVKFNKLGENMLTVHYEDDQQTYLEFFSTEPIETLIRKRASFIIDKQQHRDTTKWYNGLFSIYDMKEGVLRGPDNNGGFEGWHSYVLACDDPALCKAPFLAAKNVYFPDNKEIEAIEYYIENFVWNGLQRTDTDDPYPYGIYGVPNWKVARDIWARTGIRSGQLDRMQVWRSYDYPHIFMMYYHMYQIAKMYPEKVNYLDAKVYLERAYQTARAFFLYPLEIWGEYYETYKIGCYNELIIEDIIQALEENDRQKDADWLRREYEKKVKYFIYDDEYPYASEFPTDRTAFESSYAFAKYGVLNDMHPDTNLWFDKVYKKWYSHPEVRRRDAREFMDKQHNAGLAVRGWLETTYFQLGADRSLSYMSKMGGWSVLDYGINFADEPYDWLQLGYASYLSSFALMNTGTIESDYGFWSPGKQNDGAMGWSYVSSKGGRSSNRSIKGRGARIYCGEADLGNGAITRMASTVLTNDPLFGWFAYGGLLYETDSGFSVIPRDGLRARFSLVTEKSRLTVELDRDAFVSEEQIFVEKSLKNLIFTIENRTGDSHKTRLTIFTPYGKVLKIKMDGKIIEKIKKVEQTYQIDINISESKHIVELSYSI